MAEGNSRYFNAQIIDFNKKRMEPDAAAHIPIGFRPLVADYRQYPFNIAAQFPEGVSWLDLHRPFYFKSLLSNPEEIARAKKSDVLIMSGSGQSAYYFQQGIEKGFDPGDFEKIQKSQELVLDFIGQGKWVLGICFGGQIAVNAVKGTIGRLPTMLNGNTVTEAGWLEQSLTPAASHDPVFNILPPTFYAPHLHSDFVSSLPPVGTVVKTPSGEIQVTKSEILAVRKGYVDNEGLKNPEQEYTQASVIEFSNGARIYQIQPHPEMATAEKANFLVRQNPWIAEDMGQEYYEKALKVPTNANFAVAKVIESFIDEARNSMERKSQITFIRSSVAQNLEVLAPYLLK